MNHQIPTREGERYVYYGPKIKRPWGVKGGSATYTFLHSSSIIRIVSVNPTFSTRPQNLYTFIDNNEITWILDIRDVRPLSNITWLRKSIDV